MGTFCSMDVAIILSSMSVILETYVTSLYNCLSNLTRMSETNGGLAFPICAKL